MTLKVDQMVLYVQPEMSNYKGRTVYKFICPEGCVYIGIASTSYKRINKHRTEAYEKKDGDWRIKTRWKKAVRRIGWDNLVVEILECVPEDVSLVERERYWIAQYNANDPEYGYNMNRGGGGPTKHTEETKKKQSLAAFKRPVTSREIKEEYADGTQLVEYVSYPSSAAAARNIRICLNRINECCHKKRRSTGGRFWHFTTKDDLIGEHIVPRIGNVPRPYCFNQKRAVISVSQEGKKQLHESSSEAARTLSTPERKFCFTHISACCLGNRKSHHKYKFYFATPEMIAKFKQASNKRKRQ